MRAKKRESSGARRGLGRTVAAALLLAVLGLAAGRTSAEEIRFFRIGTGAISGSLFAVGSAIANIISNPPGSRPCDRGGSCGVPNLVAVAQSTEGSIENVHLLGGGMLESALAQADIVYWAYYGTGPFQGEAPIKDIRAVANLFALQVHIVTRQDGGILRVSDLLDKRVSIGPEGSGTPVNALAILTAYGIGEEDFTPVYLTPGEASDSLEAGEIDAYFVVGGVPVDAVTDLAQRLPIRLLPIDGPERDEITSFYPFLIPDTIQAGSYQNVGHAQTVGIGTQFLMSGRNDEELAYLICRALWLDSNQILLAEGHELAGKIRLESAQERVAIPLHPGAARCYEELAAEAAEAEDSEEPDDSDTSDED